MKERPILFSTQMVKTILDGRKTVTRRVIKPQPVKNNGFWELYGAGWSKDSGAVPCVPGHSLSEKNPYGRPGHLLYVRETWKPVGWSQDGSDWRISYKAGGPSVITPHMFDDGDNQKEQAFWIKLSDKLDDNGCPFDEDTFIYQNVGDYLPWKPSIHMPKNASRIWLRVKEVRVERLQDISFDDILDEGIGVPQKTPSYVLLNRWVELWDSINDKRGYSWDSNPWVWVVSFDVVSTNGRPGNE